LRRPTRESRWSPRRPPTAAKGRCRSIRALTRARSRLIPQGILATATPTPVAPRRTQAETGMAMATRAGTTPTPVAITRTQAATTPAETATVTTTLAGTTPTPVAITRTQAATTPAETATVTATLAAT